MSAFGDALTRLMTARGVGVHELARRSNYTAGHVSNLRWGAKRASPQCAAELDDILAAGGELIAAALRCHARQPSRPLRRIIKC